jgi:hypothetical protein
MQNGKKTYRDKTTGIWTWVVLDGGKKFFATQLQIYRFTVPSHFLKLDPLSDLTTRETVISKWIWLKKYEGIANIFSLWMTSLENCVNNQMRQQLHVYRMGNETYLITP